jgi:hypothetical protein
MDDYELSIKYKIATHHSINDEYAIKLIKDEIDRREINK